MFRPSGQRSCVGLSHSRRQSGNEHQEGLPPREFSIGRQARSAIHCDSAWKATSNCSQGSGSYPGQATSAAPSEYAPGTPWYATLDFCFADEICITTLSTRCLNIYCFMMVKAQTSHTLFVMHWSVQQICCPPSTM